MTDSLKGGILLSDLHPQFLFQILLADQCRLFRRSRLVWNAIQLDHGPTTKFDVSQCGEYCGQINSSPTEFDKAISAPAVVSRLEVFHVFDMQKEQSITVLPDRLCRVAATLLVMGDV